ncbi:Lrp/AsnC family transcriptional regulator [Loigolactobacillus zhaoyuanensis]|uniref:Lrp/AsnC family transcriptional regulator n=1 Tax=Loigolactobacillus zhaoyuanensis TaxID=2486017 RepID=A0ABW8UBK5_9LACO|nr:Lrp/AsnC family transcriptional regulator [Loigolactobacillus zhaoyuanensis]
MDATDRKLLNLLQNNARTSLKDLAKQAFISAPTAATRLNHLEQTLLHGYQAQIDYKALGYVIKAYVSLDLQPTQKKQFYRFVDSIPNVLECDCITGQYSMIMQVIYRSTEELDDFINHLQEFGRTTTQIVFSNVVATRGMQLEDAEK